MAQSRRYFAQNYFYLLSERGELYHLNDPLSFVRCGKVPSGPTFIRSEKFLDFFFKASNLCRTPPELPHARLFPFVSRCGKEGNFIAVRDVHAPVVFTAYDRDLREFTIAGSKSLKQKLAPEKLCEWNGRLFCPLDGYRGLDSSHSLRVRRSHRDDEVAADAAPGDAGDSSCVISSKAQSECCDPLEMENELLKWNQQNVVAAAVPLALSSMGLVASSVAFEIGFEFMDEREGCSLRPQYTISLDDGKTLVDVRPLT